MKRYDREEREALLRIAQNRGWSLVEDFGVDTTFGKAVEVLRAVDPPRFYRKHHSYRGSAKRIVIGVFDTGDLTGAFSVRSNVFYCIVVSLKLIFDLEDISYWAFSYPRFLDWANDHAASAAQYEDLSTEAPARDQLSINFVSLMLLVFLLHEIAHIRKGHCDFFGLNRESTLLRKHIDEGLFDDKIGLDIMSLCAELEADEFAMTFVYSDKAYSALRKHLTMFALSMQHVTELITSAICLSYFYIQKLEVGMEKGSIFSYPPTSCRLIKFTSKIKQGKWVGELAIKESFISAAIEGVRSVDYLALVDHNFKIAHNNIIKDYERYAFILDLINDCGPYFNDQLESFRIVWQKTNLLQRLARLFMGKILTKRA